MKIKGLVTIKKYDLENNLLEEQKQENIITIGYYKDPNTVASYFFGYGGFSSKRLTISDQNTIPIYTGSIGGTKYYENTRISNIFYPNESPAFGEIIGRFDAPLTTTRTVNTVGLDGYCYTLLSLPCIQGQFEYLEVYYRIQFIGTIGINFKNNKSYKDFSAYIFNLSSSFWFGYFYANFAKFPTNNYTNLSVDYQQLAYIPDTYYYPNRITTTFVADYYKGKNIIQGDYNFAVGRIFSTLLHGISSDQNTCYDYTDYQQTRIIQNGFWKKNTANNPFFDPTNFGSSQGIITLINNNWIGEFPDMIKLEFGTSGNTGTATYRFKIRKFLGFSGNNYTDIAINSPYRNYKESAIANLHGWDLTKCIDILKYSNTKIIQYDITGVTLLDVYNGDFTTWNAITTPALPVTNLRQVSVDTTNSKIYCACRDTGLYVIDVIGNTVTNLVATNCYGVDVGSKIWAIFNGSLRNSDNWAATVPFTFVGISDGNWSKVMFLKADPLHANHRICIVRELTANNYGTVWFDSTLTNGVLGYNGSEIGMFPSSVDICDTSDFWATYGLKLSYGSNTTQSLNGQSFLSITHAVYGVINAYKIDFYQDYLICSDRIVNSSNTSQNIYTAVSDTGTNLHLTNGICVFSKYMRCLFTDNIYIWQSYGWDGTNWVLNNANYKTTHTSEDILINGLKIKFANGQTGVQFSNTEHFVISACYGLLKDSATTIYHEVGIYLQQLVKVTLTPITISGTTMNLVSYQGDANALIIEGDSPQMHTLTINNVPVGNVYVNGFFPEPGAVTIDVNTGTISFNPIDVGKTLAGNYYYLSR
ncbi:MAG TPA: hypothetical protein V6C58_21060 [Allocoleopsis sp.]